MCATLQASKHGFEFFILNYMLKLLICWCLLCIVFVFRNILTEEQAVQSCKEKFQFSFLSKDSSVSPMQMSDCCERLLEEDYPDLKNTTLIVSKYYHVNEDGQISIPWNWKWISYLDGRHICFHFALFS